MSRRDFPFAVSYTCVTCAQVPMRPETPRFFLGGRSHLPFREDLLMASEVRPLLQRKVPDDQS